MIKSKILIFLSIFCILFLFPIYSYAISDTTIKESNGAISISNNERYHVDDGKEKDLKQVDSKLEKYKEAITFVGGLATITMVLIFMKHCIKLGVLGTEHWALKRNSIMALLWSGLAAALLGSSTLWFAIAYNLFK